MRIIEKMVLALMPQLGHVMLRGKGGGGGGQQQTVTENKVDPDIKEKWISMFGRAEDISKTPYQQFQGDMIAGFTPEQLKGFSQYEQGVGTGLPALDQAVSTATGLSGRMPTDAVAHRAGQQLSDYMNPFTDQVINRSVADMDRARQLAMGQMGADATAAGAFGGSRHGVAEVETNRNYFDAVSDMVAGQRQAGYEDSFNRHMQDLGLQTQVGLDNQQAEISGMGMQNQAAALLAGLSGQQRDQVFGDAQVMSDIGAEKQAMNQAELDLAYSQFLEEQNYPVEHELSVLQSAFGQAPMSGKVESTTSGDQGGGKIICSMMNDTYGFGHYRNKIWLEQSAGLDPAYQRGYHKLGLPLIEFAKGKGVLNRAVKTSLEHIARRRTVDIWKQKRGKRDRLGQMYRLIFEPLCYVVGKFLQEK